MKDLNSRGRPTLKVTAKTQELVLKDLLKEGYWVNTLEKTDTFSYEHFRLLEGGTVRDKYNNYSTWTVYVSASMSTPLVRVVKINHEYFNLII